MFQERKWFRQVTAPPQSEPRQCPESRAVDRVIHIVLDGISQDFLLDVNPSTLSRMMAEGTWARNCHTIWPSITGPAHTAMNSGSFPGTNRVTLPYVAKPDSKEVRQINPLAESRAESVVEALARNGYRSAGICGHMNRSMQYFVSEFFVGHDAERVTSEAIEAIRRFDPDYLQVVYFAVDTVQHKFGVRSPDAREALEWVDGQIGRLIEESGRENPKRTAVVVSADHGQVPASEDVTDVLMPLFEKVKVEWHGYGRFVLLWAENPEAQLEELKALINSTEDLSRLAHAIWTRDKEFAAVKAQSEDYGSGALLLNPGYTINSAPSGRYLGNHGAYTRDEIVVPLVFWGEGIVPGKILEFAEIVDVAPTICALFGCEPPEDAEGQVLPVFADEGIDRNLRQYDNGRSELLQKMLG